MKVVIVGDGKVGGTIARQLSGEGHDIIVIDNNTSVLNNASNMTLPHSTTRLKRRGTTRRAST